MREALNTEPDAALSAALIVARRRRIGPFRRYAPDPSVVRRELGVLARAGFARNVAVCALEMDLNEAENTLGRFRENLQG
jgi:regulatory protein